MGYKSIQKPGCLRTESRAVPQQPGFWTIQEALKQGQAAVMLHRSLATLGG
jgi:hypothetical protein